MIRVYVIEVRRSSRGRRLMVSARTGARQAPVELEVPEIRLRRRGDPLHRA